MQRRWIGFFFLLASIAGCQNEKLAPEIVGPKMPAHFPPVVYTANRNPYSEAGIALGRDLFYEPMLSIDGSISCGSCHAQVHAFADHNTPLSRGVNGRLGKRNTPPMFNLIWNKTFMWDGSINHIEVMPIAPLLEHEEMASNWDTIMNRLNASSKYRQRFLSAFGNEKADDQKLLFALAQFMGTMVSADAKFDQVKRGLTSFSSEEQSGYKLFQSHCNSCHTEPLFTSQQFFNIGLDSANTDIGRMRITRNAADLGAFKVPSLRNVMLTYPYMHNGSVKLIGETLNHFAAGSPNPDARLREDEKQQLIAFLKTLSDYSFVSNPAFAPAP